MQGTVFILSECLRVIAWRFCFSFAIFFIISEELKLTPHLIMGFMCTSIFTLHCQKRTQVVNKYVLSQDIMKQYFKISWKSYEFSCCNNIMTFVAYLKQECHRRKTGIALSDKADSFNCWVIVPGKTHPTLRDNPSKFCVLHYITSLGSLYYLYTLNSRRGPVCLSWL